MSGAGRRLVWWLLAHARGGWALRLRSLPLVGLVVHTVSHRLWPVGRRTWIEVEDGLAKGLSFSFDPRYDAKLIAGRVEPELQTRLPQLVGLGSVVWDVGAHVGFFTLALARLAGPQGRVVAYEPDEENIEALGAATVRNEISNVVIRPVAVWSAPGTVIFQRKADVANATHGAVVDTGSGVAVAATSLDAEVASQPIPTLVKIDVEGGEEQVLIGARRLLVEHRPIVVCEVHLSRRGREELLPRVRTLLEAAGYTVEELDPGRSPVHVLALPS